MTTTPGTAPAPAAASDPHAHHPGALVKAWVAVVLIVIGFILCTLALPVASARVPLFAVGGASLLAGLVVGITGRIMDNVEY